MSDRSTGSHSHKLSVDTIRLATSFLMLCILTVWWITLDPFHPVAETENARYIWGGIYQVMAYWGGINGLFIARKWGGYKSVLGRAILAFSIGLLCQAFGQTVYTFYLFYLNVEAPYPSLGDLGYFGTIPFYIYGVVLLSRVIGVRISLKSYINKIQALLIPLVILGVSYFLFLKDYTFDLSDPLKTFLDFGYPFGQAIYVSLAILAFILSRRVLGGIMRLPILVVLLALVIQYLSDYIFLYQFNAEQWYVAGINDYMYLTSYFLMTFALINLGLALNKLKST